jgi:N-acetylneuraminic acid mutarotase
VSSSSRWMRGVAGIATILAMFTGSAHAQGKWQNMARFPEPSQEIGGTAVNGKVYVFGGLSDTPKGLVWEYDAATNTWTKKKPMPLPAHHVAVAAKGDKLYLFGGGSMSGRYPGNWVPINNAWEYDPVADSWKALPPMPTARGAAVAAAVGNKIYVIGGASVHPGQPLVGLSASVPHRALPTNEAFDLTTQRWEPLSPMPTSRNHAAIGVVNGRIYVMGGRLGAVFVNSSPTDVVEEYDPATNSWGVAKARMPMPRSGTAYGVYQNQIFVAGGEYLHNDIVGTYRDFEAYDPVTNEWVAFPPLPVARHGLVGGVTGNKFYVVSGHLQSGAIYGDAMDSDETSMFDLVAK